MSGSEELPRGRGAPEAAQGEDVKQELVHVFSELLERLWKHFATLIGVGNTSVLFHSALLETRRHYPFLRDVEVDEAGSHLARLRANLGGVDNAMLRSGLLSYVERVIILITDLTGEVLVHKVEPLVQHFKQHLEE